MMRCEVLAKEEIAEIHRATLEVMQDPGVRFTEAEALDIFSQAGISAGRDGTVKFKPEQVEKYIRLAPGRFVRKGTEERYDVDMGGGKLYPGGASLPIYVIEPDTRERRDASMQDMLRFSRLVNGLENLYIGNGVVQPAEIPLNVMHAIWNQNAVTNMDKPSCCWYAESKGLSDDTLAILTAAAGGANQLREAKSWAVTVCPDRALTWGKSIWGILGLSKAGIPVEILPVPFCGSTHPCTIAGALVQVNAEVLSAAVLAQIIAPGCPVIYAPSYGGIMDMAVGTHAFATPESALLGAAAAQLGKSYGLPVNITIGPCCSKIPDSQAAYEKMMMMATAALAGADCMSLAAGLLDFGLSASYEQMVIDDEIAGQVLRIREGFRVDEETLAVDVIREAGPGGVYMGTEHTLHHFRKEFWFPHMADRNVYGRWSSDGRKDMAARAKERAEEIMRTHRPKGIPEDRRGEMEIVVKEIFRREKVDYEEYRLEKYRDG